MIKVQEAVQAALKYLPDWLGGLGRPLNLRVEEVLPPEPGKPWRVTLSFLEAGTPAPESKLDQFMIPELGRKPPAPERVLRVMEIDPESGAPLAMKSRD